MSDPPKDAGRSHDGFPEAVKRRLAQRVGYLCSNPSCRALTVAAGETVDGVVMIGEAAHIAAAAPGGPRRDPAMPAAARSSVENGIWLCRNHHRLVDADPGAYPSDTLRVWKHAAERAAAEVLGQAGSPASLRTTSDSSLLNAAARDLAAFRNSPTWPAHEIGLSLRLKDAADGVGISAAGVAAIMDTFPDVLIRAAPGRGKTVTLQQILVAATEGGRAGVLVPLPEWAAGGADILATILKRRAFRTLNLADLEQAAEAGGLAVGLDGWNELDAASRVRAATEIRQLRRDFPDLGVLISSRRGMADLPISGPVLEIGELTELQQRALAMAESGDVGLQLLERAWNSSALRELIRIPLYLSALLAISSDGRLPETRDEVIARVVATHESNPLLVAPLEAATGGVHRSLLEGLASEALERGTTSLTESEARAVIARVARDLAAADQIAGGLDPRRALDALGDAHLLIRTGEDGVTFPHQQIQEWYAAFDVAALMLEARTSPEARAALAEARLDRFEWEEAILFAAERLSRRDADGAVAVSEVIVDGLSIDPMLCAALISRSSEAAWSHARAAVQAFVRAWHEPGVPDRAFRFMARTAKPDFAEAIWAVIGAPDRETHLGGLNAMGRISPTVLGDGLESRLSTLDEEHRGHILGDLARDGGYDGMHLAAHLALADASDHVKVETVENLTFRGSYTLAIQLLNASSDAVWETLATKSWFEPPDEAARSRLAELRRARRESEFSPERRIAELIYRGPGSKEEAEQLAELVARPDLDLKADRIGANVAHAFTLYPDAVGPALLSRLRAGLELPYGLDRKLGDSPFRLDGAAIGERMAQALEKDRVADDMARVAGPQAAEVLVAAYRSMREVASEKRSTAEHARHLALRHRLPKLPAETLIAAVMARRDPAAPKDAVFVAELVTHVRPDKGRGPYTDRLDLPDAERWTLATAGRAWAKLVLEGSTSRGDLSTVAQALGRIGDPALATEVGELLAMDHKLWAEQRDARMKALQLGRHIASEASMSHELVYGTALENLAGPQAEQVLKAWLTHLEFGPRAAITLRRIAERAAGIDPDPPPFGRPEFENLAERRAARRRPVPEHPTATLILDTARDVLAAADDPKDIALALALSVQGFSLPFGDRSELIEALMRTDATPSLLRTLVWALVRSGEVLAVSYFERGLDRLHEAAKTEPWLLQDGKEIVEWLALIVLSDTPERVLDLLPTLAPHHRGPYALHPVFSALAVCPDARAEDVLERLIASDPALIGEGVKALEDRATAGSLSLLLDLLDCETGPERRTDLWEASRALVAGMKRDAAFRARLKRCYPDSRPRSRAAIEMAFSEAPSADAVLLMIAEFTREGRAKDALLSRALEHVALGERPSERNAGWFEYVPQAVQPLRKALFDLTLRGRPDEGEVAQACLEELDEIRDRHGVAAGDRRHPDIETGRPWPILPNQRA